MSPNTLHRPEKAFSYPQLHFCSETEAGTLHFSRSFSREKRGLDLCGAGALARERQPWMIFNGVEERRFSAASDFIPSHNCHPEGARRSHATKRESKDLLSPNLCTDLNRHSLIPQLHFLFWN